MLRRFLICFTGIILFNSYFSYSAAQITRLLWYNGKRIDESTLLTSSGQTVKYNRAKHRLTVNTSENKDLLAIAIRELNKSEQRKKELNQVIMSSIGKTFNAAYATHIIKAIDETQTRFKVLGENSIDLPGEIVPEKDPSGNEAKEIPANIQAAYDEVMKFMAAIKTETIEPPPIAPSIAYDYCYPCDPDRKAKYIKDSVEFMKYLDKENSSLSRTMEVIHLFDLLKSKQILYDSKRASLMLSDMYDAIQILSNRIGKKWTYTWKAYNGDATKLPFITQQLLGFVHFTQLMGLSVVDGFPAFDQIMEQSIKAARVVLSDALTKNDYKILLNMQWVVSLYRIAEMLGMSKAESDRNLIEFININRFKLSVDVNAKLNKDGTSISVSMKGDNYFRAVPDSNCVLQWTLNDDPKMQFNLVEATMENADGSPTYTGTKKWKSSPASLRLDFCVEERDTAFLFGFSPMEGKEIWTAQGKEQPGALIPMTFFLCFVDVERLKENAADPTLQARREKEINETTAKLNAAMGNKDPSTMTPEELAKLSAAMNEAKQMLGNMESISPWSFLFKERLTNFQKTVLDTRLNGKELFPENPAIVEAIFHMTIEHDKK